MIGSLLGAATLLLSKSDEFKGASCAYLKAVAVGEIFESMIQIYALTEEHTDWGKTMWLAKSIDKNIDDELAAVSTYPFF